MSCKILKQTSSKVEKKLLIAHFKRNFNFNIIWRIKSSTCWLGMIQQLRNAVVAPSMGKIYGRIMPLLRQGWLVRQKIMHYGFFGQCFSGCLCNQEETSQLQQILLFWMIFP